MRRHSRATATGSGKMMIDLRHEHEFDTAGTWWSAMGQNRRWRQPLRTAALPSTAEEPLLCPVRRSVGTYHSTLMSAFTRRRQVNWWLASKRWFWALPGRAGGAVV